MKTIYLKAEDEAAAGISAEILKNGGLVAIPTETVYGLAANALDPEAVRSIFRAKGRPQDNPLIVHVSSMEDIYPLVEKIDPRLPAIAERFWPGPLTVIMKKSELVPDEVTAGLDTVAIRMPSHPFAAEIIRRSGVPFAAPSANASGKPSPTCAAHVAEDMDGRIDAIVDGGECDVGVESTVITLVTEPPTLLRPGGVTPDELREVLGEINISHAVFEKLNEGEKAQSPGMKYKHYAPAAQVTIIKGSFESYEKFLKAQKDEVCAVCFEGEGKHFDKFIEYGRENDSDTQAHRIFDALRQVDAMGCERAFVRCPVTSGVGLAVYNRLLRSAAFRVIDLDITIPVIGLTGLTGAGKSTAGLFLAEKGCRIVDADILARKAVESRSVLDRLREKFGEDVVENGVLNRKKLAARAFASEEKTELLNSVTHPEITLLAVEEIHKAESEGAKAAVIDAPLLFECPLAELCGVTLCVTAPYEERKARIIARDSLTDAEAELRMSAQKPEEYYLSRSDIIIRNGKNDNMRAQLEKLGTELGL